MENLFKVKGVENGGRGGSMGNMLLNLMGLSWFKIESLNLGEFGVNC